MSNDIIKFLGLEDDNIEIVNSTTKGKNRILTIEKKRINHYCPICSFKMHSKGIYQRRANHPIMQDGQQLVLLVNQRRWKCTNPICGYCANDEFTFLKPQKRNTNITDLLVVMAFKDPQMTARQIADTFSVSDTYAITAFSRYVDMPKRQLSEAISIDEVYVDMDPKNKYAMVILDFITGEPIDMLPSRRKEVTEQYFASLSRVERARVKYLIVDMYRPYSSFVEQYFPNAITVIDSFHVVKMINHHIHKYILELIRKQRTLDEIRHDKLEQQFGRHLEFTPSKEYYLLKNFQWIILKNNDEIIYNGKPFFNRKLNRYVTIGDIERMLFEIDPHLEDIRDLKEKYIRFNKQYGNRHKDARNKLNYIISEYECCPYKMYHTIALSLRTHFDSIVNSFIMVERHCKGDDYIKRLSNGPIEALNRIVKDMKRNGRGYRNFDHLRNRFLFSQRDNATILGVPKSIEEVAVRTGQKRGPYKKR